MADPKNTVLTSVALDGDDVDGLHGRGRCVKGSPFLHSGTKGEQRRRRHHQPSSARVFFSSLLSGFSLLPSLSTKALLTPLYLLGQLTPPISSSIFFFFSSPFLLFFLLSSLFWQLGWQWARAEEVQGVCGAGVRALKAGSPFIAQRAKGGVSV